MSRLSLTSWSMHHDLTSGALALTDLPAVMKAHGIGTLELCHFHLPDTEPATIAALRGAIEAAGVELLSILIDAGDISHADPQRRSADRAFVEHWIDVAAALGAQSVRVVAGESPSGDQAALERAAAELRLICAYAADRNVRVRTENFRSLLLTSKSCNALLDMLDGQIGLCADIGNFPGGQRISEFAAVAGRAEVVHVKAEYDPQGAIQSNQLQECLSAGRRAGFNGAYTLVYDRGGDSWAGLATLATIVQPYL